MAKIAVLAMGAHGHVNPTLALAEGLARRGHEVSYWVTDEFRSAVESTGVGFRGFDSLFSKAERPSNLTPAEMIETMPKRFLSETLHVLDQITEPLASEQPDLLLYDNMALAGRVLASSLKLPAGTLCTSYAGNERFHLLQSFPELPATAQAEWDELMADITRKYGSAPFGFSEIFRHAEGLNLVFMPRSWQPEGNSFDESFVFVGPCLGTRAPSTALPAELFGEKPLLFISLGTAWNDKPEFYRLCFEAFADAEFNVLMAVGTKVDIAGLGQAPRNFTLRPHVPQLEVLKHTNVFLTHGGMNSTMEALSAGVPLVALPQMFEQAQTARRIAEKGVGLNLETSALTAEGLREAIQRVAQDPERRQRALEMQRDIQSAGGPERAADAVESHLAALNTRQAILRKSQSSQEQPLS